MEHSKTATQKAWQIVVGFATIIVPLLIWLGYPTLESLYIRIAGEYKMVNDPTLSSVNKLSSDSTKIAYNSQTNIKNSVDSSKAITIKNEVQIKPVVTSSVGVKENIQKSTVQVQQKKLTDEDIRTIYRNLPNNTQMSNVQPVRYKLTFEEIDNLLLLAWTLKIEKLKGVGFEYDGDIRGDQFRYVLVYNNGAKIARNKYVFPYNNSSYRYEIDVYKDGRLFIKSNEIGFYEKLKEEMSLNGKFIKSKRAGLPFLRNTYSTYEYDGRYWVFKHNYETEILITNKQERRYAF